MPNIVIIGSGPAGVSAALYTARAGVETTVLTKGPGALDRAAHIQNYYGFAEPISGAELERRGIEGARALGVQFVTTEAVGLTYTDKLTVETLAGEFPRRCRHPGHRRFPRCTEDPRSGRAGRPWCELLRHLRRLFLPGKGCGGAGQRRICPA